jgi:hypothetical protein
MKYKRKKLITNDNDNDKNQSANKKQIFRKFRNAELNGQVRMQFYSTKEKCLNGLMADCWCWAVCE